MPLPGKAPKQPTHGCGGINKSTINHHPYCIYMDDDSILKIGSVGAAFVHLTSFPLQFLFYSQQYFHRFTVAFLFIIFAFNVCVAQQKQVEEYDKKPYTHLPFNEDTGRLQFAIVSDLWGGNRPGIFEDAVDKLNLLQPQLVLSVGDLTSGKTHNTAIMEQQWNDFNSKVQPLTMPFFYVPGNHDIGNADMEREWQKRFGNTYYHFVYKNVLFLCLNTEDGGASKGISDEQVKYFQKVIADHPNVRWTF